MNIFILDESPGCAARQHCDKHVVKMIIEAAQMLSTAHRVLDGTEYQDKTRNGRRIKRWRLNENDDRFYKGVHVNHPCTIWTRQSKQNYEWHYDLFTSLCDEYTYRYGKVHETDRKLRELLKEPPKNIGDSGFTEWPQCMPDYCKDKNVIEAYRNYYRHEKKDFAVWTTRKTPTWFSGINNTKSKLYGINI
tara:strand:+ start:3052 stop:3624 length:573 start_codon:yes stop_codon:yes gene_type:complete